MDGAAPGSVPLARPGEPAAGEDPPGEDPPGESAALLGGAGDGASGGVGDGVTSATVRGRPTGVAVSGGVAVAPRTDAPSSPPHERDGVPVGTAGVEDPEGPPFGPVARWLLLGAAALAVVAGFVLRFWTRSDLWLDEALTVNIARLPLHDLHSFLQRDGAPPLYYVLLHFWMGVFGTSDVAVRSLSGVMGVATLPLAWLAGRRLGGRAVGVAAVILLATSPFAVHYDTEARMYALVALLTALGFLALDRSLRRPRPGNLAAVAVVTGLLLYSHYWSLYLVGAVLLWLAFQWWRGRPAWRAGARASLFAVVAGCLTFLPWLPTFLYQSRHTGTPWATPANFAAMVNAIATFAGGSSSQGRALALVFFALIGLALFGLAVDRRHVDLDLRTRPLGRPLAVVVAGTLAAAIVGGFATRSAFDPRYASIVFVPLILLVALGLAVFRDRRVRAGVLAAAAVLGLAASVPNVVTNRTQAGQVASHIAAVGQPGDVVVYCPDQLGPAVWRLLPPGRYRQLTFPHGTGAEFVDWVDYKAAVQGASVTGLVQRAESAATGGGGTAGPGRHRIFVVWAPGYQYYGLRCEGVVQQLQAEPGYRASAVITGNPISFYQPMWMVQLTPTGG